MKVWRAEVKSYTALELVSAVADGSLAVDAAEDIWRRQGGNPPYGVVGDRLAFSSDPRVYAILELARRP